MKRDELLAYYPRLFHVTALGNWESISRVGLLSTSAILDKWEVGGERRIAIERQHRPQYVEIMHEEFGTAKIRDQKPMSDTGLRRCLGDGLTPAEWYALLNRRVFFWPTRARLSALLQAKAYRDSDHEVLEIETADLLERHEASIWLSHMNTGATKPYPHPRGEETFRLIRDYPYRSRVRQRGRQNAIAEIAVDYAVPNAREIVMAVDVVRDGAVVEQLWRRA